jgi:peptidyl-dipeptidase A
MEIPMRSYRPLAALTVAVLVALLVAACGGPSKPTVAEAEGFVARAEASLLEHWIQAERASWVQSNFITEDTEAIAAEAQKRVLGVTMDLAAESTRFDGLELPYDTARKIGRLKTSITLPAPRDAGMQAELAALTTSMEADYGRGQYCPEGRACMNLDQLSEIMATSRKPEELLDAWTGWRSIAPPLRPKYQRFVELANAGAEDLGFADVGALWRSGYDMDPDAFAAELDRLWEQVRPLYEALHCHARASLAARYGEAVVPPGEPIPAHLLGNMWAQEWGNVYDLIGPKTAGAGFDLTRILQDKGTTPKQMVEYGERFFTSLGFEPLPETFWTRSLFTRPRDREVVCHASAWAVDMADDLRVKMCIQINGEDFATIHHELGHNFYQREHNKQPPLYADSANDGFHEALGDVVALSITPDYLAEVGLLEKAPQGLDDTEFLMRRALDKVAFLPFGLVVDQWRWKVFSGEVPPDRYNEGWWALREQYQGVAAPVARSEADFDAGAKYHVPANTPYTRYFLAHILQFQMHRALCEAAGHEGPLHTCSIYGNAEAGARLKAMMEMGASRPWPDALEALTGSREMDASAVIDYFAPLKDWLDRQNQGRTCGWN